MSAIFTLSSDTSGEFTTLGITPVPLPVTTTLTVLPSTTFTSFTAISTTTVEVTIQRTSQSSASASSASSTSISTPASSNASAAITSPPSSPSPSTPAPSAAAKSSATLSSGAKVGIGTSSTIAGPLLIAIVLFFLFRRRYSFLRRLILLTRRRRAAQPDPGLPLTEPASGSYAVPGRHVAESLSGTTDVGGDAGTRTRETPDSSRRELPSNSRREVPSAWPLSAERTAGVDAPAGLGAREDAMLSWRTGLHEMGT